MRHSSMLIRSAILGALGAGLGACGGNTAAVLGDGDGGDTSRDGGHPGIDGSVILDGSGQPPALSGCMSPQPILVAGKDTGFDTCKGGRVRRRAAVQCPSALPRANNGACRFGDAGTGGSCSSDTDCKSKPLGVCEGNGNVAACSCSYGCVTDGDCATGEICDCADPVGRCTASNCTDATSCGGGECGDYDESLGCGFIRFACQTPHDTCFANTDCESDGANGMCVYDSVTNARACRQGGCAIGRPFLVSGESRVAPTERRREWAADLAPSLQSIDSAVALSLARHWTEVGQLEHASIAAFARFALELLAFGAPPELLDATHRAMKDETAHARIAFGLATAYAAEPVGPGPLSIRGAIEPGTPASFLERVVLEGCVGETLGALEAREGAAAATDPAVRAALLRIAEDETRHAALAWQTAQWLVKRHPKLSGLVAATVERGFAETIAALERDAAGGAHAPDLAAHGVLSAGDRAALARAAVGEVARPCAEACLAAAGTTTAAGA